MAKRAGMYKSDKRKKEVMRQKKQEEKRLKRLKKADGSDQEIEGAVGETESEMAAESGVEKSPEVAG